MRAARFTKKSQLGAGGFGTVWVAQDSVLGRDVALKVLHPYFLDRPRLVARFMREAEILARLEHPNIVRALAWGLEDEPPYIALELIEGEPLSTIIAAHAAGGKHLSKAEIVRIFTAISGAAEYAHSMGIVHRDLKPS